MADVSLLFPRFAAKVAAPSSSGCWEWVGARLPAGYGVMGRPDGGSRLAHRISYEMFVGPIADGLSIDHLCRNTGCVNPAHLEPVPQAVNVHRGDAGLATGAMQRAKTHCPQGHAYDEMNTRVCARGKRSCITCSRVRDRDRKRALRSVARSAA